MKPEQIIALTRLINRTLAALPDSLQERKSVLNDLLALTPTHWRHRGEIASLLLDLDDVARHTERAQLKFTTLLASPPARPSRDGNGGQS